jgi:hypothetical protein
MGIPDFVSTDIQNTFVSPDYFENSEAALTCIVVGSGRGSARHQIADGFSGVSLIASTSLKSLHLSLYGLTSVAAESARWASVTFLVYVSANDRRTTSRALPALVSLEKVPLVGTETILGRNLQHGLFPAGYFPSPFTFSPLSSPARYFSPRFAARFAALAVPATPNHTSPRLAMRPFFSPPLEVRDDEGEARDDRVKLFCRGLVDKSQLRPRAREVTPLHSQPDNSSETKFVNTKDSALRMRQSIRQNSNRQSHS